MNNQTAAFIVDGYLDCLFARQIRAAILELRRAPWVPAEPPPVPTGPDCIAARWCSSTDNGRPLDQELSAAGGSIIDSSSWQNGHQSTTWAIWRFQDNSRLLVNYTRNTCSVMAN